MADREVQSKKLAWIGISEPSIEPTTLKIILKIIRSTRKNSSEAREKGEEKDIETHCRRNTGAERIGIPLSDRLQKSL